VTEDFVTNYSGSDTRHVGCGQEVIRDDTGFLCECGAAWDSGGKRIDDTVPLKDIARLDLKPGDILVVTLAGNATSQEAAVARERILSILGDQIDEHHLLVIPETAKVSVLRTERADGDPVSPMPCYDNGGDLPSAVNTYRSEAACSTTTRRANTCCR
jgi:hypothetical protein